MYEQCRAVVNGRNPYWRLPVDVAARQAREDAATAKIVEELRRRKRVETDQVPGLP